MTLKSKIVVAKSTYHDLYEKIGDALDVIDFPCFEDDDIVSIKINLCDARTPETGAITHPLFLDALLKYVREKNNSSVRINVVESDATVASPNLFIKWFGFEPVLKKWNARYVNLSEDLSIHKDIDGRFFKKITIPMTIEQSDYLISLAKLKTCSLTKISCALKNQFGCLPKKRKVIFHKVIDDVIADCNLAMRPDLSIVDGIIAHVTAKGPAFGKPVPANIFLVSNDPVSVDSYCAKILGFRPYFVGHIRRAATSKVGNMHQFKVIAKGLNGAPHVASEFGLLDYYLNKVASRIPKR